MLVIIDYGVGNLTSVLKACRRIELDALVSSDLEVIASATKIILPGVGAFGDGISALRSKGIDQVLKEAVDASVPVLGICLGMQLLGMKSEETPGAQGLGFLDFHVKKFVGAPHIKVPHVGWNEILPINDSVILKGVKQQSDVYFVHSYHVDKETIDASNIIATCEYGEHFVCAVQKENVYGVQFHPEKSQKVGLKIIENFIRS